MGSPNRMRKSTTTINDREYAANRQARYELTELFQQAPAGTDAHNVSPPDFDPAAFGTQATIRVYSRANRNVMVTGAGGFTGGSQVCDPNGGVLITTHNVNGSEKVVVPMLSLAGVECTSWKTTQWRADKQPVYEAVMQTGPSIVNIRLAAGFKLTVPAATAINVGVDAHQALIHFDTASGVSATKFRIVTGAVDVVPPNSPTVAASTRYLFRIEIDRNRYPHYYVKEGNKPMVCLGTGPQMADPVAVGAAAPLLPVLGLKTLSANARAFAARRLTCSRLF